MEGEGAISPDTAKKATPYSLVGGGPQLGYAAIILLLLQQREARRN